MIGSAVRSILLANSQIVAEVGQQIFPVLARQEAKLPYLTYRRYTRDPAQSKEGVGSYTEQGVEVSVYSDDYDEAEQLGDLVFNTIMSYTGGTLHGIDVVGGSTTQYIGGEDFWSEELEAFRYIQEFIVDYKISE